jgi:hypothetical protein
MCIEAEGDENAERENFSFSNPFGRTV